MVVPLYIDKSEANDRLHLLINAAIPLTEGEAHKFCEALEERMYVLIGENYPGKKKITCNPSTRSPLNYALGDLLNEFTVQIEALREEQKPIVLCNPLSESIDENRSSDYDDTIYCGILEDFKNATGKAAVRRIHQKTAKAVPELKTLPKPIYEYSPAETVENLFLTGLQHRYNHVMDKEIADHNIYLGNQYRLLESRLNLEIYNCLASALGADKDRLEMKR